MTSPLGGAAPNSRGHGWAARAIRAHGASSPGRGLAIVAALLGLSWLVSYALGGAGRVPPHWFYVPVLVAAAPFGLVGAAATAVVAGLIAGPLLPLDVATVEQQQVLDWSGRLGFFLGIGLVMGAIIVRLKSSLERDRANVEAELAKQEAEQANQAKSEFLSRMSHELRTPLNAILGFGQLLKMEGLGPGQEECVQQIMKGGKHLLDLINEVLDIARIESGRLTLSVEPIVLAEALQEALDLIRPLAAELGIELKAGDSGPPDRFVEADRQRVKQVLLNLLSNAVKYNRPGGSVTVGCTELPGGGLRVEVTDEGPGIRPEMMDRLFVPFERLGAEATGVEGTGLGLALSKRLMEAMGGTLGVDSAPGRGSTFFIEMPPAEAPGANEEDTQVAGPLPTGRPKGTHTVLYIEDNTANLRLIERALTLRPDLSLLSAMQGSLGLDLARQHLPDLIMLDMHLPDISGEELLRHLQGDPRTRDIPVIVISADATPGRVGKLLSAGARAYLTKPLDMHRFFVVVNDALEEQRLDHTG
jgi:signal transduction histidine kinase/ActR/RegA family two-component response regulator